VHVSTARLSEAMPGPDGNAVAAVLAAGAGVAAGVAAIAGAGAGHLEVKYAGDRPLTVGRCRMKASTPEMKARLISALDAKM